MNYLMYIVYLGIKHDNQFRTKFICDFLIHQQSLEAMFQRFERTEHDDDHICKDILFQKPSDGVTRCMMQCFSSLGCERIFFFPGYKVCTGCTSRAIRTSQVKSISYVPCDNSNYTYLGCYPTENNVNDLIPNVNVNGILYNTIALCSKRCVVEMGYQYFGTQEFICFCGNSYNQTAPRSEVNCDITCSGNRAEICGGAGSISLYVNNSDEKDSYEDLQKPYPDRAE